MPKRIEAALRRAGRKRGYTGERLDRFVYGILRKRFGWKPSRERRKHNPGRWGEAMRASKKIQDMRARRKKTRTA